VACRRREARLNSSPFTSRRSPPPGGACGSVAGRTERGSPRFSPVESCRQKYTATGKRSA
jgi:hypothetical protein